MGTITITYNEMSDMLNNSIIYNEMSDMEKMKFILDFIKHNKNKVIIN